LVGRSQQRGASLSSARPARNVWGYLIYANVRCKLPGLDALFGPLDLPRQGWPAS